MIPSVVPIVVASLKAKTLEKELQARGALIERELALQQALFTALAQEIKTDLTVELSEREIDEVIKPFASNSEVPNDWAATREDVLSAMVASQNAGAAATANELRLSFQKLTALGHLLQR